MSEGRSFRRLFRVGAVWLVACWCGAPNAGAQEEPPEYKLSEEATDPFAPRPDEKPVVRDEAYWEKRARDDAERWQAFLKRCQEPDLSSAEMVKGARVCRFTFRPHFAKTLMLTLRQTPEGVGIEVLRLGEKGRELEGWVPIEKQSYDFLWKLLENEAARDPLAQVSMPNRDALWGLDGAWWHLEVSGAGRYTHAVVWSPHDLLHQPEAQKKAFERTFKFPVPDLKPFAVFCAAMADLAEVPIDFRVGYNYDWVRNPE